MLMLSLYFLSALQLSSTKLNPLNHAGIPQNDPAKIQSHRDIK